MPWWCWVNGWTWWFWRSLGTIRFWVSEIGGGCSLLCLTPRFGLRLKICYCLCLLLAACSALHAACILKMQIFLYLRIPKFLEGSPLQASETHLFIQIVPSSSKCWKDPQGSTSPLQILGGSQMSRRSAITSLNRNWVLSNWEVPPLSSKNSSMEVRAWGRMLWVYTAVALTCSWNHQQDILDSPGRFCVAEASSRGHPQIPRKCWALCSWNHRFSLSTQRKEHRRQWEFPLWTSAISKSTFSARGWQGVRTQLVKPRCL